MARAEAGERGDLVVGLVAGLGAVSVGSEHLTRSAVALAGDRSADRAALRARLDAAATRLARDADAARTRLEEVAAAHQGLLTGADWARRVEAELPSHVEAVTAARHELEARQAEQRAARAGLDKVLEQRAVAGAAMEDANRQLGELVGAGMDESALRRELEAAGRAVRAAEEAHAAAVERAQELVAERERIQRRGTVLRDTLAAAASTRAHGPEDVDRIRRSLADWRAEAARRQPDPDAQALVEAFTDLTADLAELQQQATARPDAAAVARAEAEAARAAREVERFEAQAAAGVLDPGQRAEIDAAHDAVLLAEERLDRRIGAAAARQRLAEAREVERELLARHGFPSYLDVVLSGGRATTDSPERLAAERTYLAATAARDGLRRAMEASPELHYLETERARLLAHAVDLLGVDPGDDVIALLRGHPLVPRDVVVELREALAQVGVHPVGVGLASAAEAWLAEEVALLDAEQEARSSAADLRAELDALEAREAELDAELASAGHGEADAAEQLEMAGRSVGAFEAELSLRVGEDAQRLKRFAAADQLRIQVEALAATLARAEEEALATVDRATEAATTAELDLEGAQAAVDDLGRRAHELAGELPADRRPPGDPLTTLSVLAERLAAYAEVLQAEVAACEMTAARAVADVEEARTAAEVAGTGAEGPRAEDLHDAFAQLLELARGQLLVLDEPLSGLDPELHRRLLRLLAERPVGEPVVYITDDADVLGWAIGLPAEQATVLPGEALLNLGPGSAETSTDARSVLRLPDPRPAEPEPHHDNANDPSARRSAGRR